MSTPCSGVILGETNPTDFQYLLQTGLSDRDPRASSLGLSFDLDEGPDLDILGAAGEAAFLGTAGHSERGPRLLAAVVTVPDLEAIKARAEAAGLSHAMRAGRLVVDASADFSFILAFEEAHK